MATVNLGVIKPVFKGAYSNSTAYVLDNIVTSGGSSYICILASTGNAVSNATYWSQMSAIGTNPQLSMTWDNATADADNGAGKIAWNHATIASATILYVDDVDDAAASIATYIQSWDDVANATAKGIVTITKEGAPAVFATFKVTGSITDASGYSKIPVTHLVSAGSFSDGDGVAVSFAYSGLDGADGSDGTDVGTVITTAGDILYRDGSGLQRLAKGTAGQSLTMNSGATAPEWGTGFDGTYKLHDFSRYTHTGAVTVGLIDGGSADNQKDCVVINGGNYFTCTPAHANDIFTFNAGVNYYIPNGNTYGGLGFMSATTTGFGAGRNFFFRSGQHSIGNGSSGGDEYDFRWIEYTNTCSGLGWSAGSTYYVRVIGQKHGSNNLIFNSPASTNNDGRHYACFKHWKVV